MNKADYIALVDSKLPDGGSIPSSDHRDTMHTDVNSIGELVYGETIVETSDLPSIFTPTTGIVYNIKIQKVGRIVFLEGSIRNTSASSVIVPLLIADDDYKCTNDTVYNGIGFLNSETIKVNIQNIDVFGSIIDRIRVGSFLLPNEQVTFSLTYNTQL